ncbi:hypothetical protein [Novosphingobium sp. B 225]|nr:hypothetical protein [Novosphingobium sp. B 225]
MGSRIGRNGVLWLAGLVLAGLFAWAWIDGGARPLRPLAEPVSLPGVSR